MSKELQEYKNTINKQIEKLGIYFAKIGIAHDFNIDIEIPEENMPLAEIFQYLSLIQDNLRILENENSKHVTQLNKQINEINTLLMHSSRLSTLGEITAGVAHELNQPLNGIKIICQSLLRDFDKDRYTIEDVVSDLRDIVAQVNRMAEIVDHMRIYTRKTIGDQDVEININHSINDVFKLIGEQLKIHNIDANLQLGEDIPLFKADTGKIQQVIMNLVINARHAVEDFRKENRLVSVTTRTWQKNKKNNYIIVEISDNGCGINKEIQERMFEPFFTSKEPGKGTGLGLAIVEKIVNEYNGKIEVESKEGHGSTFRILFPYE